MVNLNNTVKSGVRFHLGYSPAVPGGDRARLEALMSNVPDTYTESQITILVARCETAFANTAPTYGDLIETEREDVTQVTIKQTVVSKRESESSRQRIYQRETTLLANAFGVRNYRDETIDWQPLIDSTLYEPIYINQLPIAGSQGQVLAKKSNTAYDVEWQTVNGTAGGAVWGNISGGINNQIDLNEALNTKQDELVSGINIKTINGQSLLWGGNIVIAQDPVSQIPILIRQCF